MGLWVQVDLSETVCRVASKKEKNVCDSQRQCRRIKNSGIRIEERDEKRDDCALMLYICVLVFTIKTYRTSQECVEVMDGWYLLRYQPVDLFAL